MGVKLLLSAELAAPGRASSALECRRPSGDTADTFGLRASPTGRRARSPIAGRGSGAASPRFHARCGGSSESNARPAAWGCRGSGRRCGRRNTVPSERISWTLPPAPTRMRVRAVQRANCSDIDTYDHGTHCAKWGKAARPAGPARKRHLGEIGSCNAAITHLRRGAGQSVLAGEAQHVDRKCLETPRELLDQPPHCGLLFAGTHELEAIFTRQALELEQWRSRFHAGQALPGLYSLARDCFRFDRDMVVATKSHHHRNPGNGNEKRK